MQMTEEQQDRADYIKSLLPERFQVKDIEKAGLYKAITIRSMLAKGDGPKVYRIGCRVILDRNDFIEWLNVKDEERLSRNAAQSAGHERARKEKATKLGA